MDKQENMEDELRSLLENVHVNNGGVIEHVESLLDKQARYITLLIDELSLLSNCKQCQGECMGCKTEIRLCEIGIELNKLKVGE